MLDIELIRDNPEKVKEGVRKRGFDPRLVDHVLAIDKKRRKLIAEVEKWRQERNKLKEGEVEKGKKIKATLKRLTPKLRASEEEFRDRLAQVPNLPAGDVPEGKEEGDNVEIKKWGKPPKLDFKPKDHLELGEKLDIIDVRRAAKVSGSRFNYLKGDGALLELALVDFGMKLLVKKGFIPIIPPAINKKEVEWGLGYSEHGGWNQMYLFEKDGLAFTPSSEHTIIPQHKDEVLSKVELPLRYAGFSSCFRREAGTYGKDTRGIFRVHQFDKVEMNVFTVPDVGVSDEECLNLLSIQEELIQALKIPYRVVACCTGDLPFPNRRMYDLEAWLPGQGRYKEIKSCSNCTDFQTRRLNIKVRLEKGAEYAHALNATAIAVGRTIIAILENYQQKNGSVVIPAVLQPYVGKKLITA